MLAIMCSLMTFLQVFQSHPLICASFFVAAAISQLEVVAASPTCAIFPQTRTWRQLISRHSQNQIQQSWVLFGLVPGAVCQHRKFFSKPMLCWPSCILYNYCKSISSISNCTSTTPTGCCSCVYQALAVDLWLGTKLWNVNLNNCEMKKKSFSHSNNDSWTWAKPKKWYLLLVKIIVTKYSNRCLPDFGRKGGANRIQSGFAWTSQSIADVELQIPCLKEFKTSQLSPQPWRGGSTQPPEPAPCTARGVVTPGKPSARARALGSPTAAWQRGPAAGARDRRLLGGRMEEAFLLSDGTQRKPWKSCSSERQTRRKDLPCKPVTQERESLVNLWF